MTNTGANRQQLRLPASTAGWPANGPRRSFSGRVAAASRDVLVAGDIGPTGSILAPTGTLDYDEAVDVFAEQAEALAAGGVDHLIETMSNLAEISAAIERPARGPDCTHRHHDLRRAATP
jgi:methionine synthase I (cobalamin-dependent)